MSSLRQVFTRSYTICFVGTFFIYCSVYSLIPIMPLYLAEIGKGSSEIGIIIGAFSASSIVLRPLIGRLVDMYPKRLLMAAGTVIFIAAPLLYLIAGSNNTALALARLFHGMGLAAFATTAVVTVTGVVPQDRLAHATGIYVTSVSAAMGVAPLLSSIAMKHYSFSQQMAVLSLLASGILLLLLFLREPGQKPSEVKRQAFIRVLSDSNVVVPSLAFVTCTFSLGTVTAFLPLYVQSWGGHQTGLFFFVYSTVLVLIRLLGGGLSDSLGRKAVIVPSLLVVFLATAAFVIVGSTWSLSANAVLLAIGVSLLYPTLNTLVVERVAFENRGTALGIFSASVDGGFFIGPVTMGYVGGFWGMKEMFLAAAAIPLLGALLFLRLGPSGGTGRQAEITEKRGV